MSLKKNKILSLDLFGNRIIKWGMFFFFNFVYFGNLIGNEVYNIIIERRYIALF